MHCRATFAPNTTTFLPPAAACARATASSIPSLTNVPVIDSGTVAGGWCVSTKNGPLHAPP
jgi:hypothetical protein